MDKKDISAGGRRSRKTYLITNSPLWEGEDAGIKEFINCMEGVREDQSWMVRSMVDISNYLYTRSG